VSKRDYAFMMIVVEYL